MTEGIVITGIICATILCLYMEEVKVIVNLEEYKELKEAKDKLDVANSLIVNIYKNYSVPFNYNLLVAYLEQNNLLPKE